MGVKGLWRLMECTGIPVPLETLEQKVLAVDVSIWLHQAVKGFKGVVPGGQANAPLLTLFHRICKLLFYRIRPIFVFDGGVPYLKKQTLASRRLRREVAVSRAKQVRERLLNNLLRSQAVRDALGKSGPGPSFEHVPKPVKVEKDMFDLQPLPKPLSAKTIDPETTPVPDSTLTTVKTEEGDSEDEAETRLRDLNLPNLHQFEFESEAFQKLPIDVRHEILTELQGTRKENCWANLNQMPQELENFAEFQMGRLRKRRKFQETLDNTRDEIRKKVTEEIEAEMFGELQKHLSFSQRIISEDATHSILIKKVPDGGEGKGMGDDNEGANSVWGGECDDSKDMDRKGKSPAKKRKRGMDLDFLTELAKHGVLGPQIKSDSESDWEDDSDPAFSHSDDDTRENRTRQKAAIEEASFLKVVGSLMENSGLTQQEILALIKQEEHEKRSPRKMGSGGHVSKKAEGMESGPSTSSQASGFVFNPDADSSSDDDDLIEVPQDSFSPLSSSSSYPSSQQPQLSSPLSSLPAADTKTRDPTAQKKPESNNLDEILGTKNNSLWMKIVQQKVDDMVYADAHKRSPAKAPLDSRKVKHSEVSRKEEGRRSTVMVSARCRDERNKKESEMKDSELGPMKGVKISLDFDVKPLKMEDDIFADIFTDIHCAGPALNSAPTAPQMTKHSTNTEKPKENDRMKIIREKERVGTGSVENGYEHHDTSLPHTGFQAQTNDRISLPEQKVTKKTQAQVKNYTSNEIDSTIKTDTLNHIASKKSTEMNPVQTKDVPSGANIDAALHDKINELVRLEIEKLVNAKQTGESSIRESQNSAEKIGDMQVDDEIMSSSDESETDENKEAEERENKSTESPNVSMEMKEVSNEHRKTSISTKTPDDSVQVDNIADVDSDTDDEDFIEVSEEEVEVREGKQNKSIEKKEENSEEDGKKIEKDRVEEQGKSEKVAEDKGTEEDSANLSSQKSDRRSNEGGLQNGKSGESKTASNAGSPSEKKQSGLLSDSPSEQQQSGSPLEEQQSESPSERQQSNKDDHPSVPQSAESDEVSGHVEPPLAYSVDELKHLEGQLAVEQDSLVAQAKKSDRLATSLNDQTYGESQHLLQLFGIPYLVAPMEAEAQCGFLDAIKLTSGTITDDSDIFLFGGTKVYKHFFNQIKHVEFFKMDNITATIGLDRSKMISLAMLTGSDYTEGVESVGGVAAMEVLAEFPGEGIDCLKNLKKWWNAAHRNVAPVYMSKVRNKMSKVSLSDSFPNERVFEAYLTPEVDESGEKFSWSVPNVEALRVFTGERFGWSRAKTDEILVPVMKRLGIKTSQMRIDSYFTNIKLVKENKIGSKRVQDAITKAKGEKVGDDKLTMLRKKAEGRTGRPQGSRSKKRKAEDDEEGEEMGEGSKTVLDNLQDKSMVTKVRAAPSRSLLIDPSEALQGKRKTSDAGEAKVTKLGNKRKANGGDGKKTKPGKRKKRNDDDDGNDNANGEEPQQTGEDAIIKIVRKRTKEIPAAATTSEEGGRKLTKEIMFKALLKKEKINQREEEARIMRERKKAVAELLKSQRQQEGKKKGKR